MKTKTKQEPPISLRLRKDLRKKVEKVADRNGLSLHATLNLCAAAGLTLVEKNLAEIHHATAKAAA